MEEGLARTERWMRASRTGAAVAKIYLGYKGLDLVDHGALHGVVRRARRRWHRESARTLHDAALDLGGLFLKAGQYLSTRADVLPPAYGEQLVRLQDRVPPHPYRVVRRVLEEELGPMDSNFRHFWRQPVASASLAQVHRAVLHDGSDVAVKIQRPEIGELVHADIANLRTVLGTLEWIEGDFGLSSVLDELADAVPLELDFEREAANAKRIREAFADDPNVRIPEVVDQLTTHRVLVTEYISGTKITDLRRLERLGIDHEEVAAALVNAYAAQVLRHGFFHADPHPGNLLITSSETPGAFGLAFVDFGLAQEVPPAFRDNATQLAVALLKGDTEGVAAALSGLGIEANEQSGTLARIAELAVEFVELQRGNASPDERDAARLRIGNELTEALRADPETRLPSYLWGMGRVLGLLSGVAATLGVKLDLVRGLLPHLAALGRDTARAEVP